MNAKMEPPKGITVDSGRAVSFPLVTQLPHCVRNVPKGVEKTIDEILSKLPKDTPGCQIFITSDTSAHITWSWMTIHFFVSREEGKKPKTIAVAKGLSQPSFIVSDQAQFNECIDYIKLSIPYKSSDTIRIPKPTSRL